MWNENELDWKRFCPPFRNVLQGSMILVTTRSPKVADVVRTMDPFPLDGLNDDVFQKFFKLCVFGSDSSNIDPELECIGKKILPKLKGSPLAAKTLGRLLGMSLDPTHWDRILKSHLWELQQKETDILPALRLSYMYLPFYLKRCFPFCALYPKDYDFGKEELAEIWVAEGFVQHQPNVSLQHTAGQYIEELAHLSFFQKHPWMKEKYVIHDLMHDMAQLVSKDEFCVIKDKKDFRRIPKNVLHLSVLRGGDVKCSDLLNLCKHKKLHTLFCHLSLESETGNTTMEKWCTELLCMPVMVCFSILKSGLPDSISNMKHLRYLQILKACLCKRFPAAFCCLYNMHILYAKQWEIDNIPIFDMLINLQKFESVKYQFHRIHSVDIREGATDEGQIRQLKLTKYNGEELPRGFHPRNLTNIMSLWFEYLDNIRSITYPMSSMQIHSYNNTFSSLADVQIINCQNLSSLEQFLQPAHVPVIKKIEFSHCGSLELVPTEMFGDLHFLEVLMVSQCPQIKSRCLFVASLKELYLINSGNLGGNTECGSLTILHLSNYPLESIELQMKNLPLLHEHKISSYPSLAVIRDSDPISSDLFHGETRSRTIDILTDKVIQSCQNLSSLDQFLQPGYATIKKIEISHCGSSESVPTERFGDLRFLEVLRVSQCPQIKSRCLFAPSQKKLYLTKSRNLGYDIECSSLTIMHLWHYPLESIELQMWNLLLLQKLEISSCPSLTIIRDSEPISTNLFLFHGGVQSRMGKFPLLTHLTISFCEELKTINDLLILPAIESITISACGLLSLPANRLGGSPRRKDLLISTCRNRNWQSGMLLPSSLQNLALSSCGDFSAWFPSCLENLTSLKSLQICDCDCILSVSGHLWSSNLKSLQKLKFIGCSGLKSIGGPDAIAHIRDLVIDKCSELMEIDQPMRRGSLF